MPTCTCPDPDDAKTRNMHEHKCPYRRALEGEDKVSDAVLTARATVFAILYATSLDVKDASFNACLIVRSLSLKDDVDIAEDNAHDELTKENRSAYQGGSYHT